MTDDETLALADRMFRAIEQGDLDDLREIYDPDIVVWANYDDREHDLDGSMRVLGWLCSQARRSPLRRAAPRGDPRRLPAGARAVRHRPRRLRGRHARLHRRHRRRRPHHPHPRVPRPGGRPRPQRLSAGDACWHPPSERRRRGSATWPAFVAAEGWPLSYAELDRLSDEAAVGLADLGRRRGRPGGAGPAVDPRLRRRLRRAGQARRDHARGSTRARPRPSGPRCSRWPEPALVLASPTLAEGVPGGPARRGRRRSPPAPTSCSPTIRAGHAGATPAGAGRRSRAPGHRGVHLGHDRRAQGRHVRRARAGRGRPDRHRRRLGRARHGGRRDAVGHPARPHRVHDQAAVVPAAGHDPAPDRPLARGRRAADDRRRAHGQHRRRRPAARPAAAPARLRRPRPLAREDHRHGRCAVATGARARGREPASARRTRSATRRPSPAAWARPPPSMPTTTRRCSPSDGPVPASSSRSATRTTPRSRPARSARSASAPPRSSAATGTTPRPRPTPSATAGCTAATSGSSTPPAACASPAGPRRCTSGAATTCTRSRSRRCWRRTPRWSRWWSPLVPTR